MESSHAHIVCKIPFLADRVQLVVVNSSQLGIKHQIAESVILVAEVVSIDIPCSLVEGSLEILSVSLLLVGVYHPVDKGKECILEGDPLFGLGVDVEGESITTLDSHETVINVEERGRDWLLREVSPESFPVHYSILMIIITISSLLISDSV